MLSKAGMFSQQHENIKNNCSLGLYRIAFTKTEMWWGP